MLFFYFLHLTFLTFTVIYLIKGWFCYGVLNCVSFLIGLFF